MDQRFQILDPGVKYRLSDGTVLSFLKRDHNSEVEGLSVEELLTVLVDRLDSLRKSNVTAARFISMAITDIQSSENWLKRWDSDRRRERNAARVRAERGTTAEVAA